MKILFISNSNQPDYLCDSVYHGLKSSFGKEVEAANDMWYMYDTLLENERSYLYGRGFTLYGLLNSDLKVVVSFTDIQKKIAANYYTYIIYGSIQQCSLFLETVSQHYTADKIIFIDGEDRIAVHQKLLKKGFYFKRELANKQASVYPISFAIPAEKIVNAIPKKERDWAINYPGKLYTYVHQTEASYYSDYQASKFAATFKKEGWDCLRHYEILANGCLPYFKDIEECPAETMVNFPKHIVSDIKRKIEGNTPIPETEYQELVNVLLDYTRTHLTTQALIKYIFGIVKKDSMLFKDNSDNELPVFKQDEALFKASHIDDALKRINKPDKTLVHFGISSVQQLRYLRTGGLTVYAHSIFKSALNLQWPADIKFNINSDFNLNGIKADVLVLDMTLSYQEDVITYMQNILKLTHRDTKVILIIPNYKSLSTVIGFLKNDLKFGRLTLAKGSQVNFYSRKSLIKFMSSFNLIYKNSVPYDFDESHIVKRTLNKLSKLKYFTCKKILMEVGLEDE